MMYNDMASTMNIRETMSNDANEYVLDAIQRGLLFFDTLRKRGNNYIEHLKKGQPPVLTFDYEMVHDGREMDPPINFALVHILGRRAAKKHERTQGQERRSSSVQNKQLLTEDKTKRPVLIIDPRAGHGPGIGGSRRDSQVGNALSEGHPVYFVVFYTEPMPGQSLADVHNGVGVFIEEIKKRHPEAEDPMIIGNCQAGWATALIGADNPEITGPLILNGAPMSFWSSIEGKNPMSYRGGLLGGVWVASLLSDLGGGKFDGANLVAGFEDLNPANTLWSKQYNLYSNIDTEEERYLKFEKWWSGFFLLSDEEIHFIVDSLFVGNKLELGTLELIPENRIDLYNIEEPVLVFTSRGDNITPPHQALNWIKKAYGSSEEIVRQGKVLVYMVHEKVGHLGIFVSKSVAAKEHKEIISNIELIRYLPPGLYEMVIEEGPEVMGMPDYKVKFEERNLEDLQNLDNQDMHPTQSFRTVAAVSRMNDQIYKTFLRPLIRWIFQEPAGEIMRQLHPLRMQRYLFSDLNPFMWPVAFLAPIAKEHRVNRSEDNIFVQWEQSVSKTIEDSLDTFRQIRDETQELVFRSIYENPWLQTMFGTTQSEEITAEKLMAPISGKTASLTTKDWKKRMETGGFIEGAVRSMISVMSANQLVNTHELEFIKDVINGNDEFRKIDSEELRRIISEQSEIISIDEDMALDTLRALLPRNNDRKRALELARRLCFADKELAEEEAEMMGKLRQALQV